MENLYYYLKMTRDRELRAAFSAAQMRAERQGTFMAFHLDAWTFLQSAQSGKPQLGRAVDEKKCIDAKVSQLKKFGFTCHFRVVVATSEPEIVNGRFRRIYDSIIFDNNEISLLSFDEPSKEEERFLLNQEIQKHSDDILQLQQKKTELNRDERDSVRALAELRKKLKELD